MRSLTIAVGSAEDNALGRYEKLRTRVALPQVEVTTTATLVEVTFEEFPAPLASPGLNLAARAVGWLAHVEGEWGSSLGSSLAPDELCFDAERALFVIGPGMVRPSGDRSVLDRLAAALGVAAEGVDSWGGLAAVAAVQVPSLAPLLQRHGTVEDTIRHLVDLADRAATVDEALRFAELAFQVRPTDPARAESVARRWLSAKRTGEPPGVRDVLAGASHRPVACLLLARLDRGRGDLAAARAWAERSVTLGTGGEYWSELARVAGAQGDRERTLDAMTELAKLGDEQSLLRVFEHRGHAGVAPVLDGWSSPWTARTLALRLEQLHREERLRDLVVTFLERLDLVDGAAFEWVLEAASRKGTVDALRQDLWRQVEKGRGSPSVVRFLARICRESEVFGPLLQLSVRHPDAVPLEWVAEALLRERRHEELVGLDSPSAEVNAARVEAMVQLQLETPSRFSRSEWKAVARACVATPDGARRLGRLVDRLVRYHPTFGPLPVLRQTIEDHG